MNTKKRKTAAVRRVQRKKRIGLAIYLGAVLCCLAAFLYFSRQESTEKIPSAPQNQETAMAAGASDAGAGLRADRPGEPEPVLTSDSLTEGQPESPNGSESGASGGANRDLPADQAAAANEGINREGTDRDGGGRTEGTRIEDDRAEGEQGSEGGEEGEAPDQDPEDPAADGNALEAEENGDEEGEQFPYEDSSQGGEIDKAARYEYDFPVSDNQIQEEPSASGAADHAAQENGGRETQEYGDGQDQQKPAPETKHPSTVEKLLTDIELPEIDIPFQQAGTEEEDDSGTYDPNQDADTSYGDGTDPAEDPAEDFTEESSEGVEPAYDDGNNETLPVSEEDGDPSDDGSGDNSEPYESPYEEGDIYLPEVP